MTWCVEGSHLLRRNACADVSDYPAVGELSETSVRHMSCWFHYLHWNADTFLPDYTEVHHKRQQSSVIAPENLKLQIIRRMCGELETAVPCFKALPQNFCPKSRDSGCHIRGSNQVPVSPKYRFGTLLLVIFCLTVQPLCRVGHMVSWNDW
jgi:hypothetical protein